MRIFDRLRLFFRDLLGRTQFEREIEEELAAFEAMAAEDSRYQGVDEAPAARAARIRTGGREQVKERLRAERHGVGFETFGRDVRQGIRLLRRQPGFSAVVILILAVGIGANTAVFSVVASVLLRPLPFAESDRLVRLQVAREGSPSLTSVSPRYFHAVRERATRLESVAAQRFQNLTLTGQGEPERVVGIGVSDGWQVTLGVRPRLGRGFDPEEEAAGSGSRSVLLSHAFWQRRFGGDTDVVGRVLRLNGDNYTVIGVLGPEFRYPYNTDLWFPMTFSPLAASPGDLNVPARIRRGVGLAEVQRELDEVGSQLARAVPGHEGVSIVARPFAEEFRRDPNRSIVALLSAVGFVLLIACANVANLMLARGTVRVREVAVRTALGGSRARQVRQMLTESLILAGAGGVLGVVFAAVATQWLGVLITPRLGEVIGGVRVSAGVLAAAGGLTVATALLFGLPSALRLTSRPADVLGQRWAPAPSGKLLNGLVVVEVALATVLLVGSGLMVGSFLRLVRTDVGYQAENLLHLNLGFPEPEYDEPARRVAAVRAIIDRVNAVPGVRAAGITTMQPIPRTRRNTGTALVTRTDFDDALPPVVNLRLVTPEYFATLGLRIVRGRGLTADDTEAGEPVLVVNQAAAARFWPDGDPVGAAVKPARRDDPDIPWHRVVGVVADIAEPSDRMPETVYQAYDQATALQPPGSWFTTSVSLMVRTSGGPKPPVDAIRAAVHEVDPTLPLFDVQSMEAALREPLADRRLGTTMTTGFGLFGLFMAALGTYGVLAFAVSRRIPEIGVRMAMGARPGQIFAMILRRGMRLVGVGLLIGLVAAFGLTGLLERIVPEVDASAVAAWATAAAALLGAGLVACWLPAQRAVSVDPLKALRSE